MKLAFSGGQCCHQLIIMFFNSVSYDRPEFRQANRSLMLRDFSNIFLIMRAISILGNPLVRHFSRATILPTLPLGFLHTLRSLHSLVKSLPVAVFENCISALS